MLDCYADALSDNERDTACGCGGLLREVTVMKSKSLFLLMPATAMWLAHVTPAAADFLLNTEVSGALNVEGFPLVNFFDPAAFPARIPPDLVTAPRTVQTMSSFQGPKSSLVSPSPTHYPRRFPPLQPISPIMHSMLSSACPTSLSPMSCCLYSPIRHFRGHP